MAGDRPRYPTDAGRRRRKGNSVQKIMEYGKTGFHFGKIRSQELKRIKVGRATGVTAFSRDILPTKLNCEKLH